MNNNEISLQIKTNTGRFYLTSKRIIDIILSIIGLLCLSPLMIVIIILIKLEDWKGQVIFKQIRVGEMGKPFYIYKFRSMVSNAEERKGELIEKNEANGPVFKMRDDPRVKRIGKFIRKTSIDELPQLFNVLKGEMSLVGPRPPLPQEVELYTKYQWQRLTVVPGLTCYWQVNGRSNIQFDQWIDMDLQYICDRSLWVDIKLILKTIFVLLGSKGAF